MKNKSILIALLALVIAGVTVITVSCRKEPKHTKRMPDEKIGLRTQYEETVACVLAINTVLKKDIYGLSNTQISNQSVLAAKAKLENFLALSMPVSIEVMTSQYNYFLANYLMRDPDSVYAEMIDSIAAKEGYNENELEVMTTARDIFNQDFSSMSSSEVLEQIVYDAQSTIELYWDSAWFTDQDYAAAELLLVTKAAAYYCLEHFGTQEIENVHKVIQATASGFLYGYNNALALELDEVLERTDNGLYTASFVGGMIVSQNVPWWKRIKINLRWGGLGPINCGCPTCTCPCPLGICIVFGLHHDPEPNN